MSSTSKSEIVTQGPLRRYSTKENKWVEKYYVLYSANERNASRLDWYDSEKSYKHNPTVRKTLFVEEIQRIDRYSTTNDEEKTRYGTNFKHALKLQTYRSPEKAEILEANNEKEANKWKQSITQLVEAARTRSLQSRTAFNPDLKSISDECYRPNERASITFDVEIDDTAAANLCDLYGHYKLVLSSHHVSLVKLSGEPALAWEYCNVRRYGFGSDRFTLEGGHRAGSAQGLFIFKNCHGSTIRSSMEEKMRDYQRQMQRDKQPPPPQLPAHHSMPYAYVDVVQKSPTNASNSSSMTSLNSDYVGPSDGSLACSSGETSPVSSTARTASIKKPAPKPKPKPTRNASAESAGTTSAGKTGSSSSITSSDVYINGTPIDIRDACSRTSSSRSSNGDGPTVQTHRPGHSPSTPNHDLFQPFKSGAEMSSPTSATPATKMSHVLDQMNKLQMASGGRVRQAPDLDQNTYDRIDLLAASTAVTNFALDTAAGSMADKTYDPTHLYGPITNTGPGGATIAESEYAEVGARM